MSWRTEVPFNELPRLPPASQVLEITETLKLCIGPRASLAELKQAVELLPNQSLLINLSQPLHRATRERVLPFAERFDLPGVKKTWLLYQPYCRIHYRVDCGVAKRQTASTYIKQLVDISVLEERQIGREKLFVN